MKIAAWSGFFLVVIACSILMRSSKELSTKEATSKPQNDVISSTKSNVTQFKKKQDTKDNIIHISNKPNKIITRAMKILETKKVLKQFVADTGMIVPKIDNISFHEIDNDSDTISIIHGEVKNATRSVTVIASKGIKTPQEALQYLKEEASYLPGIGKDGFTLSKKIYTVPSKPGLGFTATNSILIGKPNRSGITMNGILLTRQDGKGTYLYLIKTHKDFFDKNEGKMDMLYNEIELVDKK
jgi:hypothetical protein